MWCKIKQLIQLGMFELLALMITITAQSFNVHLELFAQVFTVFVCVNAVIVMFFEKDE